MADSKVVKPRTPPNAGKGRVKGSLNKTTKTAKEAIAFAAEQIGGAERLAVWVKESQENEKAFWTSVYPKLLPLQLSGDPDHPVVITKIERVVLDIAD